ncbi:winged helix-turn-helix domain-containing protein [bacterium]|nr:winged helix-turn-helix domain-containing protein [bacterium]
MITEIGITAGEIWQYLEKYNNTTLSKVVEAVNKNKDIVMMSLGWLAREGHITVDTIDNDLKIVLRKKD